MKPPIFSLIFILFSLGSLRLQAGTSFQDISGHDFISGRTQNVFFKQQKHATVLVFLSSRCPCSDSHIPAVKALASEWSSKGFKFIGIHSNANESFDEASQYFKEKNLPFPVIQDKQTIIANHFEAYKTPHVFVINPSGETLFQGGIDDSRAYEKAKKHYLKEAIIAIHNGQAPLEKNVRVMGCEIQRP